MTDITEGKQYPSIRVRLDTVSRYTSEWQSETSEKEQREVHHVYLETLGQTRIQGKHTMALETIDPDVWSFVSSMELGTEFDLVLTPIEKAKKEASRWISNQACYVCDKTDPDGNIYCQRCHHVYCEVHYDAH